jgi:hypothetical protein
VAQSYRLSVSVSTTAAGSGGDCAHVEQVLAAFQAYPHGEAGQITRTLLFNCMVKEQTQQEEQNPDRSWRFIRLFCYHKSLDTLEGLMFGT